MTISEQDIREQLSRLLKHPDFAATPQRRAFLTYVVDEYLAGRADQIKGVSIAMSVFDRDASFDQQVDPVVRLEARRLRQDIDGYYAGPGRNDPIRLSIPKGGYSPRFERVEIVEPHSQDDPNTSVEPEQRFRWPYLVASFGLLLGLILFAVVQNTLATGRDPELPNGPVIAVLPFTSPDDAQETLADGITQQLTTELVRFRDLWILPLGTVSRYRQQEMDPQQLRDEFGTDFALEGSVLETGDQVTLSARLIDLNEGRYSWVRSYTVGQSPGEIYAAQDQIVRDVTGQLAGKYGLLTQGAMQTAARTPPGNRDAYDCVLDYYSYQITINLERHGDVLACIQNAVKQDPGYAEAWAVLSNLYLQQIRFNLGGDRAEILASADMAARKAIQSDPNLAAGHLMLANMRFVTGDIEGFKQAGQAAVALNPNDAAVLAHYGMRLAFGNDWDEGLAIVDRAIALNPVHPHWYHFPRVFYLFDQGEYEDALTVLDRIDMPGFFWTHLWRAALSVEAGDQQQAKTALDRLLELQPDIAAKAPDIFSIWQLDEPFKRKLMDSLNSAGLGS
ncbi:hypothetical protein [Ruegeria arenilitoris]|uniref:hypothetical protein n=1 Tax=Ruegeria arenilitoris TaxID=1173585 RepID=UPI00147CCC70|nr:hypothetical protein [Ruegeria arenilitoris]